jgi:chemotaxis protein histidine kinase CheA
MAIVEAISIPIGVTGQDTVTKAANAYEDLGDAVAKTQLEAEKLANTFGINDKRTQEAIKVAGKYKQEMEQLDSAIDGARGGVATLTRSTQAVVAGFEIAAGAAGLFGGESEELQKALLKVQSAMALSQGIADLKEYGSSISGLGTMIKGSVVKAFGSLRSAIISTGIGAAVVAVGLLVANWDSLVKRFSLSFPTLNEIGAKLGSIIQGIGDFIGVTSEAERMNDKVNASIQKNIDGIQKQITLARAKGQEEKALALEGNKLAAELVLANRKLRQEDSEANRAAQEKAKLDLELNRIAQDKFAADKKAKTKADNQKALDDKKAQNAKIKEEDEKEFQEWLAIQVEKDETAQANRNFQKAREEKEAAEKKEKDEAQKAQDIKDAADKKAREDKEADDEKARMKAVADLEQEIFNNSQQLAQALINIVGQNTKAGKALALASIAADTAKALSGALANSQAPTPDNVATGGLAGIAKYIALATTILTNSKRAYDIIKAPAPNTSLSGGGGGAAAAAAAVPRFNAPGVRFGTNEEFTQVRRIYVTERDITNVQDKVRVTEGLSQF